MENHDDEIEALLARWRAGEAGAVDELLSRNQGWVLTCVRNHIGDALRRSFDSGDVQNDVNLRVLKAFRGVDPRLIRDSRHFRNWLRLKVKQTIWDLIDHSGGHPPTASLESCVSDGLDPACSTRHDPAFVVMNDEANCALLAGIALLSEEDQSLVTLRDWKRLSFEELGARLGILPSAADTRYRRALARLTDVLARLRRV